MGMPVTVDVRDRASRPASSTRLRLAARRRRAVQHLPAARARSRAWRRGELALADADPLVREVLARCEALRRETGGYFDARARRARSTRPGSSRAGRSTARRPCSSRRARALCLDGGGDVCVRGGAVARRHPPPARARPPAPRCSSSTRAPSPPPATYERGEHIVDPHTGRPPRGVLSVTVLGPELATADAYATAAFAMGAAGPGVDGRARRLRGDDGPRAPGQRAALHLGVA